MDGERGEKCNGNERAGRRRSDACIKSATRADGTLHPTILAMNQITA